MRCLSEDIRVSRVMNAVAAGSTAQNGSAVDMAADGGYDGVMFILAVGTLSSSQATSLKAQQSDDNGNDDDFSDLAGSKTPTMADDDDNQLVVLDVFRPSKRYVRPVVNRASANAVIDGVIAIQYRGRNRPSIHDAATVQAAKVVVSPAEGTA